MTTSVRRIVILLAMIALAPRDGILGQATTSAVVYLSATDAMRKPLPQLGVADLLIKEDGKEREILTVEPAALEPHVAVLVDDNGTGVFKFGLLRLAEKLQGTAQLSFRTVTNQVQVLSDYSPDVKVWMAAIDRLGVRPSTPEGGQLLEGIYEASKDLIRRESHRPVIVALTVGGDEQSPRQASQVLTELWKSHASLHVVYVNSPAVRPSRPAGKPADLLESNFQLNRVLGDGPKESGGQRREVLAMGALLSDVQEIANDLRDQFVVAYARPAAENPTRLQITSKRRGVTIVAPTRAPAR